MVMTSCAQGLATWTGGTDSLLVSHAGIDYNTISTAVHWKLYCTSQELTISFELGSGAHNEERRSRPGSWQWSWVNVITLKLVQITFFWFLNCCDGKNINCMHYSVSYTTLSNMSNSMSKKVSTDSGWSWKARLELKGSTWAERLEGGKAVIF